MPSKYACGCKRNREREGEGGRKREVRRPEIDKRAAFIELDLS